VLFVIAVAVNLASVWPAVGLHWGWNYGNAVVDAVAPVTARSLVDTRMLAIASHMSLLVVVLTLTGSLNTRRR
jgi:hypothetical protein